MAVSVRFYGCQTSASDARCCFAVKKCEKCRLVERGSERKKDYRLRKIVVFWRFFREVAPKDVYNSYAVNIPEHHEHFGQYRYDEQQQRKQQSEAPGGKSGRANHQTTKGN